MSRGRRSASPSMVSMVRERSRSPRPQDCIVADLDKFLLAINAMQRNELKEFINENPNCVRWIPGEEEEVFWSGRTLLHFACEWGDMKAIKALIEKGADVDAKDETGKTPLHIAAMYYGDKLIMSMPDKETIDTSCNMIDVLKQNGADVNMQDNSGATPLHYVLAFDGREKIAKELLRLNARKDLVATSRGTIIFYDKKYNPGSGRGCYSFNILGTPRSVAEKHQQQDHKKLLNDMQELSLT